MTRFRIPRKMAGKEHKLFECKDGRCGRQYCQRCGELSLCTVCNGAEGSLLTYCPGYRLSAEAEEACYHGNVLDFEGRGRMILYKRAVSKL